MSGNGHGGSRTLAEKRFPSTVRKSNITRRRAVRSPFRWSFFNPAIDVKLFKSRFPLNCRGFRFDRTSLQIFEITPRFMHDFPLSLSLSLSLSSSLSSISNLARIGQRSDCIFDESFPRSDATISSKFRYGFIVYRLRHQSDIFHDWTSWGWGYVCGKQIRNYGNLINSKFAAGRSLPPT